MCNDFLQDMAGEEGRKEVSEVEMLLEAYYMNLDSTWNKLTDIAEQFDDAEVILHSKFCGKLISKPMTVPCQ